MATNTNGTDSRVQVQLLTTEENVKMLAVLDDNIAGKYLRAAMLEAQEVGLRGILGSALLGALKERASARTLTGAYAELVNSYAVFYLAYATKAQLVPKVAYKVGNAGVLKHTASDEDRMGAASAGEIEAEVSRAQAQADFHAYRMQGWLLEHASELPELTQRDSDRIRACLRSAASCGIWLGGARGDMYAEYE